MILRFLNDVTEEYWLAFKTAVEESEDVGTLKDVIEKMGELCAFGDLRDEQLHRLWSAYCQNVKELADCEKTEVDKKLAELFQSFYGRKEAKLEELRHVELAAQAGTGLQPIMLPSTATPDQLVDFDLVFLDFFLGDEELNGGQNQELLKAAEQNACDLINKVSKAAIPNSTPLFVVISTLAGEEKVPQFRDNAKLLASKFRFISKKTFRKDQAKVEYMLGQLVTQRRSGDAVEKLLYNWRSSTVSALDDMLESVRRLDVTDYAYLQHYRLDAEQVSLLQYLTWLYNSYLSSLIEERLAINNADLVAPLKCEEIPPAILQPMSEIPKIYSKVTTTQIQNFDDGNKVPIWTGDLFVRYQLLGDNPTKEYETSALSVMPSADAEAAPENTYTPGTSGAPLQEAEGTGEEEMSPQPDIFAAVTPFCDLIPGHLKAKSVLLVGGELAEFGQSKTASNHLLVHDKNGTLIDNPLRFQIKWDLKWTASYPISAFDGKGIIGTDYTRVGRLRELYAAEIIQKLSADMSRVGVPVAPPFTHSLYVKAVIKLNGEPLVVLDEGGDKSMAWELYSSRSGEKRMMVFTEQFLWRLRDCLRAKVPNSDCRQLLEEASILRSLTTPFEIKKNRGKLRTALHNGKIVIKRVEQHPENLIAPTNQEVIVFWAAGPTAHS